MYICMHVHVLNILKAPPFHNVNNPKKEEQVTTRHQNRTATDAGRAKQRVLILQRRTDSVRAGERER